MRDALTDIAVTDDAEFFAREFHIRKSQEREDRALLPFAGFDSGGIAAGATGQLQNQRQGELGHRLAGVAWHVADFDAAFGCGFFVDDVGAGGGDGDEF